MENEKNFYYPFSPEHFKDEAYDAAVRNHPVGSLVYLTETHQVGKVEEVRATPDGPRIKVSRIGSVPIGELRVATEEDIKQTTFKDDVEKRGEHFFFKD